MKLLARSKGQGHEQQEYADHILGSLEFLKRFFGEIKQYIRHLPQKSLFHSLCNAILFHDLGKLDSLNQEALKSGPNKKLPVFHEDAGAAYWLTDKTSCFLTAVLIYCHHKGLTDFLAENNKGESAFRFKDTKDKKGFFHTNNNLDKYLEQHFNLLKNFKIEVPEVPEVLEVPMPTKFSKTLFSYGEVKLQNWHYRKFVTQAYIILMRNCMTRSLLAL